MPCRTPPPPARRVPQIRSRPSDIMTRSGTAPESPQSNLSVNLPVRRCGSCEFEFIDDEAERLKHDAVCEHLGVLSPGAIRQIRKSYGMTRAAFAEITGLGEATLNRWENSITVQTLANDRYMRLLARPEIMNRLRSWGISRTNLISRIECWHQPISDTEGVRRCSARAGQFPIANGQLTRCTSRHFTRSRAASGARWRS